MKLKVGCNFDPALLDGLAELAATRADRQIVELYGSVAGFNPIGTARPDFRLPAIGQDQLGEYVARAARLGLTLNYTLNTTLADPRELAAKLEEIERFLARLQELGIRRVTVAHPLIAKLVQERSSLAIELSTILAVRNARQLAAFCDRCDRIDRVCLDVYGNRDFDRIAELSAEAQLRGVGLELLANEFCVVDCIDRQACYDIHSLNLSERERRLHNNYPMGNCIAARIRDPLQWLSARFVLPQWFDRYAALGVDYVKVSGRTHSTSYIIDTVAAYMSDRYTGNLLELWADVENIGRAQDDYRAPRYHIDCGQIPDDFLDFYERPHGFREEAAYLRLVLERAMVAVASAA